MDRTDEEIEHITHCVDEMVRGLPGTVATCTCGFVSRWWVRDGSAECDAYYHVLANDPVERAAHDERMRAWHKDNDLRAEPKPLVTSYHEHGCSCHLNAPCGACENCKHFDDPDCPNDCQTCTEHEEEMD